MRSFWFKFANNKTAKRSLKNWLYLDFRWKWLANLRLPVQHIDGSLVYSVWPTTPRDWPFTQFEWTPVFENFFYSDDSGWSVLVVIVGCKIQVWGLGGYTGSSGTQILNGT